MKREDLGIGPGSTGMCVLGHWVMDARDVMGSSPYLRDGEAQM